MTKRRNPKDVETQERFEAALFKLDAEQLGRFRDAILKLNAADGVPSFPAAPQSPCLAATGR
jgi:hypothetical protein